MSASASPYIVLRAIALILHESSEQPTHGFLLHPCILVNRHWAAVAAEILWANPFAHRGTRVFSFEVFLPWLSDEEQSEIGLELPSPQGLPMINYAAYIRYVEYVQLREAAYRWVKA